MARVLSGITLLSGLLTGLFALLQHLAHGPWLSLAVTCGTIFYHFAMRLAVGFLFDHTMHNHVDYHRAWFRPLAWEAPLYRLLRVRRWKNAMPTFQPALFDLQLHSLSEVAQAMCQAELVHETIAVLSFLPLAAVPLFGALPVFLITSLLAAVFDLCFVCIQRCNRPRLLRLLERKRSL